MCKHEQLPTLPVTRPVLSPISLTQSVVRLLYLLLLHTNWRLLPQITDQSPIQLHLRLLLWMFFCMRTSSSTRPLFDSSARQCSPHFYTRAIDYKHFTMPSIPIKPRSSLSPQERPSSTQSPRETTFVQSPSQLEALLHGASQNLRSDSTVYTVEHSCNTPHLFRQSHLTFQLPDSVTIRPHPDDYVVLPSNDVKLKHYSKRTFLEI